MPPITIANIFFIACLAMTTACESDPVYLQPTVALEVGTESDTPDSGRAQIVLPIRQETASETEARAALAMELGVEIPFVKMTDLDLSLEWNIRNLDETEATVTIGITGANELFEYLPAAFMSDDDELAPPPLAGDIPLSIPGLGSLSGTFREDDIREASVDLELITRGDLNPFEALLQRHDNLKGFDEQSGSTISREWFAGLIRFDLRLRSNNNHHVVMEYAVRVRSHRNPTLIHDLGLSALAGELTTFAPATYVPTSPTQEE